MATRTPVPPGPPPRGFRWPTHEPTWPVPPHDQPPPVPGPAPRAAPSGGRHGFTVFVAIAALTVGLGIGYRLGDAEGDADQASPPATLEPGAGSTPTTDAPPPSTTSTTTTTTAPPSDDEPLGTADTPIPLGQTWVLGIFEIGVVETTVAGEPAGGTVEFIVRLTITLQDREVFAFADEIPFWVEDAEGNRYDPAEGCAGVRDDLRDQGLLENGSTVEGEVCFRVPAPVVDDLLMATDGLGGRSTYFALG
jgi:hypothetical protein